MTARAAIRRWLAAALGLGASVPRRKSTRDVAIARLAPAASVALPVGGLHAIVAVGDAVTGGELIARSPDTARWQRRLHASLAGRVVRVDDRIVLEGTPPASRPPPSHREPATLAAADVVATARDAGLLGLGGGMFPTYAKLAGPIDVVVINACESEPYFTCDHRVLIEHRDEVECGLRLAMRATGATRGLVADHEPYYPAGYERFVVRDLLGRAVPARGLPRDVGALVLNVQSARALHHAVCGGAPLIARVITVAGGAVARPGNYEVAIGTSCDHVLAACGVDLARAAAIVVGGPMMGRAHTAEDVVLAGTGGVLALCADELAEREERPCIRCGRCIDACPLDLPVPRLVAHPSADVLACIECGACQYACPSAIPLTARLRDARRKEVEWD